jgi:hypothetical protein
MLRILKRILRRVNSGGVDKNKRRKGYAGK